MFAPFSSHQQLLVHMFLNRKEMAIFGANDRGCSWLILYEGQFPKLTTSLDAHKFNHLGGSHHLVFKILNILIQLDEASMEHFGMRLTLKISLNILVL